MNPIFPLRRPAKTERGFTLVVVLSLMVLLTIIAIGLLSLSVVTMRSTTSASARATAQANARLALVIAIGDLQRFAGPDQRVTARSDILDENIDNPRFTGVWNSWEIDPDDPPSSTDYSSKNDKFLAWLASGGSPQARRAIDFAGKAISDPVELLGDGSLGSSAPTDDRLFAGKIDLVTKSRVGDIEQTAGACAWAVLDEGLKARINTPYIAETESEGEKTAQLGSGQRAGTEFIDGLDQLERKFFQRGAVQFDTIKKGISRQNFALAGDDLASGVGDTIARLTHDVTPYSLGLLTNTARGGLRQDFHLLSNMERSELPDGYATQGVYASLLNLPARDAPSDPPFRTLHEFSRLHLDGIRKIGNLPVLTATAPTSWRLINTGGSRANPGEETVNNDPPPGVVLMPTIAKVQMIFSLIGRDIYRHPFFAPGPAPLRVPESATNMHGPQDSHFKGTKFDYDLHLLYTPVVTLHNPYNVALEFREMNITFHHVPFSMQIYRNGQAQSRGLVPFETMFADNDVEEQSKVFGLNLKTERRGKPGSTTFRLLPGETKLFSPYIDPTLTYEDNFSGGRKFWDIYVGTGITASVDAIPGWRGDGIGWDCDWLAGNKRIDENKNAGRWASCLGLAGDDQIHVEFAPRSAPWSGNKFTIKMSASPGRGRPISTSAIEIDYESPTGLHETILGSERRNLRFPSEGTVAGQDLVDHRSRQIKDIVNVKPFAMLSVQAKTTYGGFGETGADIANLDGRLATKPWAFAHATVGASSQKVVSEHPAQHSHEIDLQLLDLGEGTTQAIGIDQQQRGNFITGHSPDRGSKFGAMYDIPLAPIQSLAGLNGANPGGLSGYLPRFAQPIGNSWAHPALPPGALMTGGTDNKNLLDHSFLLNLALYDNFYFSGLADQVGPFGNGKTSSSLAREFVEGQALEDPRLLLYRPGGRPASGFTDVVGDDEGYMRVAAWQLMQGAFNINSTSVPAWKAMLASVHDPQSIANLVNLTSTNSSIADLEAVDDEEARISRFRLPLSESAESGGDQRLAYWLGPREYSEQEFQSLAENIVDSVRQRGPFLSLAEFVNRQLGNDEKAQRGALQEAIDESDINRGLADESNAGFEIGTTQIANYEYLNPTAGTGPSYQGAPGFLTQADLMNVLGNAASARSDTFTIRAYGEARDPASNTITARAWCEAVVQRVPEWLDSADPVEARPEADGSSPALEREVNRLFGRRLQIASFRWLAAEEV